MLSVCNKCILPICIVVRFTIYWSEVGYFYKISYVFISGSYMMSVPLTVSSFFKVGYNKDDLVVISYM